jgi:protein-arginine kinase activator protein McsA
MTDKEIYKLAKYIVEELTMPSDNDTDQLGYHVAFFTDKQMEEYQNILLIHEMKQLQEILDIYLESEDYESAAVILKQIKTIEDQVKNQ